MGYGARFFKITKAAHEYTGQQLRQPVSTQGGDMSRSPLPCWPSRASGQGCSAGGVWGARGDGGAPVWEDGWQCGETESPARARLLLPRLCLSPDTSPSRIFKEVFTLVKKKKKTLHYSSPQEVYTEKRAEGGAWTDVVVHPPSQTPASAPHGAL